MLNINTSLAQAKVLEEALELKTQKKNQFIFDSYIDELPKESQTAVFEQLPYITPAQIQKMTIQINNEIEAGLLHPILNGSYQKNRRDIISDIVFKRIGKNIVQLAAQNTANETGKMIAYRALNPESYKYIASGFPTKPMAIKGKSAQGNLIGGLIPVDARFSKAAGKPEQEYNTQLNKELLAKNPNFEMIYHSREVDGVTQIAVFKEVSVIGKTLIVEQWKSESELLSAPGEWTKYELIGMKTTDEQGNVSVKPVTADVDLAFVGKEKLGSEDTEPVYYHETKGHVSPTENYILKAYNKNARKIGAVQDLVNHGSQANDPGDAELEGKVAIAVPKSAGLAKVKNQTEATKFTTEGAGRNYRVEGSNLKGMGSMVTPVKRSHVKLPATPTTQRSREAIDVDVKVEAIEVR